MAISESVEFGGQRGSHDMGYQAAHAYDITDPEIRKTYGVASNDLTWLLRHAQVTAEVKVSADGTIDIGWSINDTLDLNPEGHTPAYQAVAGPLQYAWNGVLGASEPEIHSEFGKIYK